MPALTDIELTELRQRVPSGTWNKPTLQRCTALGTNTAVTPTKLDPADRVAAVVMLA